MKNRVGFFRIAVARIPSAIAVLAASSFASGCGRVMQLAEKLSPTVLESQITAPDHVVSFTEVSGVLQKNNCVGCHSNLATSAGAAQWVNLSSPEKSILLTRLARSPAARALVPSTGVAENMPPTGSVGDADVGLLFAWTKQQANPPASPSPSPSVKATASPSPSPSAKASPSPSPSPSPSVKASPSPSPSPSPSTTVTSLDSIRAVLSASRNNCFACHGDWSLLTVDGWKASSFIDKTDWKLSRFLLRMNRSAASLKIVPATSGISMNMPSSGSQVSDADFALLADWVKAIMSQPQTQPSGSPTPQAPYSPTPPSGTYYQPKAANYSCADGSTVPDVDPLKRLDRVSFIRSYSVLFADLGLNPANLTTDLAAQISAIPGDFGGSSAKNTDRSLSSLHSQAWWDIAQKTAELITTSANLAVALPGCSLGAQASACIQTFLRKLATTAFSRPPTAVELQQYADVYQNATADSGSATTGLQMSIVAILLSPNFVFEVPEGTAVAGKTNLYRNSSRWQKTLVYLRLLNYRPSQNDLADAATVDYTQAENLGALVDRLLASDYVSGTKVGVQVAAGNFDDWFPNANPLPSSADAAFIDIVRNVMGTADSDALNQQIQDEAQASARLTFTTLAKQGQTLGAILGTPMVVAQTANLQKIYKTGAVSNGLQSPGDGVKRGLVWVAGNLFTPIGYGVPGSFTIGKRLMQDLACQVFSAPPSTIDGVQTGISGSPAPDPSRTHRERYAAAVAMPACSGCHSNGLEVAFVGSGFGKLGNYNVVGGKPKEFIYDSNGSGAILNTFDANEKYWVSFPNGVNRAISGPSDFVDAFVQSGMMQACFNERVVASVTRRKLAVGSSTRDACTATRVLNQINGAGFPIQNAAKAVILDPSFVFYSK